MSTAPPVRPPALREPSQRVSLRAPAYWRTRALLGAAGAWVAVAVGIVVAALVADGPLRWLLLAAGILVALAPAPFLTVVPRIRYDVHRWDVTDIAVHVRYGWLSRTDEIVPLSRVQTVDSHQGALMRLFGLRSVTVQTASAQGTVEIACLDAMTAHELVARLVYITAATPEDAT